MKKFIVLGVFVFLLSICFNFYVSFNVGQAQHQPPPPQQPTPCDPGDPSCETIVPSVVSVVFEQVYSPLDCPNNNCSNGQRIFPDKTSPTDTSNRKVVKVRAIISGTVAEGADVKVAFKAFDVDDPSNDTTIDPNNNAGNDNRPFDPNNSQGKPGTFTTTTDPTQPGTATDIAAAVPVGSNEVSVYLTVTMQPGNNVVVAASTTEPLTTVTIDGVGLKDGQGNSIPTNIIKKTELLTTWRKLHIEVDSMGTVQNNFVEGTIPDTYEIRRNGTATVTVSPTPNTTLQLNRFQGGRLLVAGNTSLPIHCPDIANGDVCSVGNTVTVKNTTGSTVIINANSGFELYDDDDFNDNDGASLDGDTGEDIPMPDICLVQGENMPSWSNCSTQENGDNAATNVFAPAYVRPIYDIGDNNNSVNFVANYNSRTNAQWIRGFYDFDMQNEEANPEFWTIYLLGAYQSIISFDGDPFSEQTDYGLVDTTSLTTYIGYGASIFMEAGRPKEYPTGWATRPISRAHTVGHEIGHLFGGDHGDGGLMKITANRMSGDGSFSPTTIAKIRTAIYP